MKRLLSFALVLATAFSAAGCSDSTGPAGSLTGTYSLRSLGGQTSLPAQLYYGSAQDHIEIINSQLTLYSDGTYSDVTRVQDTNFGPTQVYDDTTTGFWTLSGSQLTLTDRADASNTTYAYASGNTISIDNFAGYGVTAVYAR